MRRSWLLLLLVGCDDHLFPAIGGPEAGYTPDWAGTQQFLGDHCEGCHPSLSPPALPDDVAADVVSGAGRYVVSGDPEASELWLVIRGQSDQTPLMPLGFAQPMDAELVQPIADWIAAGAPLN